MNKNLIDKIMKKINAESYLVEKTNTNSALIKSNGGKLIVFMTNPVYELLNGILFYNTDYEKILWIYSNKGIEEITNNVNSLAGKKIIIPINIADI